MSTKVYRESERFRRNDINFNINGGHTTQKIIPTWSPSYAGSRQQYTYIGKQFTFIYVHISTE